MNYLASGSRISKVIKVMAGKSSSVPFMGKYCSSEETFTYYLQTLDFKMA